MAALILRAGNAFWSLLLVPLVVLVPARVAAQCTDCHVGFSPMGGHGAHSDGRRIINVYVDASWADAPGQTAPKMAAAIEGAMNDWNNARDPYGNSTGYYFEKTSDQSVADIKITKDPVLCFISLLACQSKVGNQQILAFAPWLPLSQASDLNVLVAHEIAHTLGLNAQSSLTGQCAPSSATGVIPTVINSFFFSPSPPLNRFNGAAALPPSAWPPSGAVFNPGVTGQDVIAANQNLNNPGSCTSTRNGGARTTGGGGGVTGGPGDGGGKCAQSNGGCDPNGGGTGWAAPVGCKSWADCDGDGVPYSSDCDDLDPDVGSCHAEWVTPSGWTSVSSGGTSPTIMNPDQRASCENAIPGFPVVTDNDAACFAYCSGLGAQACEWTLPWQICRPTFGQSCATVSSSASGSYSAITNSNSSGRFKCGEGGSCSWDSTDSGPNQCLPISNSVCGVGAGGGDGLHSGGTVLTSSSAVRGCAGYNELPAVFEPDGDACHLYCTQNNANACEYQLSSGNCYAEFGTSCHLEAGYSDWYSLVLSGSGGGGGGGGAMVPTGVVRGCNGSYWGPEYQPDAASCLARCVANNADSCEWQESSGDCYSEFTSSGQCYIETGWSGWYSAILPGASAASATPAVASTFNATLAALVLGFAGLFVRARFAPSLVRLAWRPTIRVHRIPREARLR